MSNLSVNQIKISKPVIENEVSAKQKVKMSRMVFDLHPDKKIWCFRQYLGKTAYGADYGPEYYCYNCKSELIFRWKSEREAQGYQGNSPFRVHEVFIEFKEKVNEYGRAIKYSYCKAYCCKCWNNSVNKTLEIGWKPCDCQQYIDQERAKYEKDKAEYSDKLNTLNNLMKQLEKIKDNPHKKWDEKETYKDYKLCWIIKDLEKSKENKSSWISHCIRNLNQLNEWEYKLKENKITENKWACQ